jgi:L-seryl-tRNA(Ser) seleniumtransferase
MRKLPKVDEVMHRLEPETEKAPAVLVKAVVQETIEQARKQIAKDQEYEISPKALYGEIAAKIQKRNRPHLQRVINATGVVLHTNLGRARLSKAATQELLDISSGYSNLEYDLELGERGSRYQHVEELVKTLTGAEAVLVVNNNAAAVYLVLDSIVKGKEVIVSRGELVEIGGSFRIPDIMKATGCSVIEVGTTNKTHKSDYENNISGETGALLKVHTSNYRIIGFTEEVTLEQLESIGKEHNLPVIYDLGSGLLYNLAARGVGDEPTVRECLYQKADIVCFSGDKLLGGPQAGIIAGNKKYIDKMKQNHLLRALRIDKLTLAALEATLRQYLEPERVSEEIPTLKMILQTSEELRAKALYLLNILQKTPEMNCQVLPVTAQIGGGAMPGVDIESYAVGVQVKGIAVDVLEKMMRENEIPIIARIWKDMILLDVRTMEDKDLVAAAEFFNNLKEKGDIL